MDWLGEVLESVDELESPTRYYLFSALAAISAIVKRNIYLNRFSYILYPNLYIFLIGESGLRKGPAISLCENLVRKVNNNRVISGRASIEAIIQRLGKAHHTNDHMIIKDATALIAAQELDTMLIKNDQAHSILTALYDTHYTQDWDNLLKASASDYLKNICITLLGASNETNLGSAVPSQAITGGFVARTLVIYEEKQHTLNPLTVAPKKVPNIDQLSKRLFEIANLRGSFIWDNSAREFYEPWYEKHMKLHKKDKTGTLARLPDTALKVAMPLSLSSKNDLILLKEDVEQAIELCLECYPGCERVFIGQSKYALSEATHAFLRLMTEKKSISRKRLIREMCFNRVLCDYIDLDRIIETYIQGGQLISKKEGNDIIYSLNEQILSQYDRILKELKQYGDN